MAARSAMRLLAAAVVVLAMASFAAAADVNNYKVDINLMGKASDYLDANKRVAFCAAFTTVLQAGATLPDDVLNCAIVQVDGVTPPSGEVTVTAWFSFTAARTNAGANTADEKPENTIKNALTAGSVTGFTKATQTTPAAQASAVSGTYPPASVVLEIAFSNKPAGGTGDFDALATKFNADTTFTAVKLTIDSCDKTNAVAIDGATTGSAGIRVNCTFVAAAASSLVQADIETTVFNAFKGAGYNDGTNTWVAVWARDTGLTTQSTTPAYTITASLYLTGSAATATNINGATGAAALRTALEAVFTPEVKDDTTSFPTIANAVTNAAGGADVPVIVKVADQEDANVILADLEGLIGTTIGTTPNAFTVSAITKFIVEPALVGAAAKADFPNVVSWYQIPIVNTSNNFTDAASQLNGLCAQVVDKLDGNATKCAIVEVNRASGNGSAGTVTLELTAANSTTALTLSPFVVKATGAITNFSLGAAVKQAYPGPVTTATLAVTVTGTPFTSAATVTSSSRKDVCDQLTTNGFVPKDVIKCSIASTDVVAGATSQLILTARLWWRLPDFTSADLLAGLKQALTGQAFTTANSVNYDTAIVTSGINAAPSTPAPATFVVEVDFHLTNDSTALITDTDTTNNANQLAFTNAISAIVGGSAPVAWVKGVAGTSLTPSGGTVVTVRIFTLTATAQADAYEALQAQANGTNTTIGIIVSGTTTNFTVQSMGFRRVAFAPAVDADEFPTPPAPAPAAPAPAAPATAAPATKTAPATPPQPQGPVTAGPVNPGFIVDKYLAMVFVLNGQLTAAQIDAFLAQLKQLVPGIAFIAVRAGSITRQGAKFLVASTTTVIADITAASAADAQNIVARTQAAINAGQITTANVVSFGAVAVSPAVVTPGTTTPGTPGAPAVAPSSAGLTSGNVDITILGTRSAFTTQDQNVLTTAAGAAVNGSATLVTIAETSTNARKFTMQASALRVTLAMTAPSAQYPSVASIVARLQTVVRSQNGRLGNSSVVSIAASNAGAAARSGPVALTILVALLVAMLSAMAQF